MASKEKALIDTLYLSTTKSNLFKALPEIYIENINIKKANSIIDKIPSKRIKNIVLKKNHLLIEENKK